MTDLDRERGIRGSLDELRALLASDPDLAARTAAMLDGELPCPALEEPMDPTLTIRLPEEIMARADALIPALEADPAIRAHGRVTRSTAIRIAILRGLDALEADTRATRKDR